MSDYIKREDAIKTVYKLREYFKCWDRNDDIAIKNALNAIPAANVVEVVRCKDCKSSYYDEETGAMLCDDINGMVGGVCKNAFCSYGEKNE